MSQKNVEAIYQLSPLQQGMLYETVGSPKSGIHIEQFLCILTANLDVSLWRRAWELLFKRHTILRTAFVWEKQTEPLQVVLHQVSLPFVYQDWSELSREEQAQRLDSYVQEDREQGFKLSHAPLLRVAVFKLAGEKYQLLWTYHHILLDGWASALVLKEVVANYKTLSLGREPRFGPAYSYERYIAWLKKQDVGQAEQFWRKQLHGFTHTTPLGRVEEVEEFEPQQDHYGTAKRSLSASLTEALQKEARRHHITLNNLLQGIWSLVLSRYSGETDVLFGCTVSGRPVDLEGSDQIIGPCINTLPIRVRVTPEGDFWGWLADIQEFNSELRQYEYSHGGSVHRWSGLTGSHLLYESLLVVENYPLDQALFHSPELTVSDVSTRGAQTKYGLTILVMVQAELELVCIYDARRFSAQPALQILAHFERLLQQITATGSANTLTSLQKCIPASQIPVVRTLVTRHTAEGYHAPALQNPLEEMLLTIWKELLGREEISTDDNFFALGGHSLLATQLAARIQSALRINLPLRDLFEFPTVAALAAKLAVYWQHGQSIELQAIVPVARDRELPLSLSQQRLWFLSQLEAERSTYNVAVVLHLQGVPEAVVLEKSLSEIIRRHESLRTSIQAREGEPFQVIGPPWPVHLLCIDLSYIDGANHADTFQQLSEEEALRPFCLDTGPLLRVLLLRLETDRYVLLMTTHHIVSDAWSIGIFVRELATLYQAFLQKKPSLLPPLPVQYADFAVWQRQWSQTEVMKNLITYWTKQLEGAGPALLPVDHALEMAQSAAGRVAPLQISAALTEALNRLSRQEGVTLFMTLFAAFQILLYRYTAQKDIVIGTDIANRTRIELEPQIGFFVNVLPLRTRLSGEQSFQEVLQQVRDVVLDAYVHQDLPFDKLIEALNLQRNARVGQSPLIHALFVLQNIALEMDGIISRIEEVRANTTRFHLGVFLREEEKKLTGYINYHRNLFDPSTIAILIERYKILLNSIVAQPGALIDALEFYTEEEKSTLLSRETALLENSRRKVKRARGTAIDLSRPGVQ